MVLIFNQRTLSRHDELRERARQLLEQARREAAIRGNNGQLLVQSPVKVSKIILILFYVLKGMEER